MFTERFFSLRTRRRRAALAGLLDDFAGATAGMAGALDGEEALTGPHPPGATARWSRSRLGALLAAAPLAGPAGGRAWHANGILLAGETPPAT